MMMNSSSCSGQVWVGGLHRPWDWVDGGGGRGEQGIEPTQMLQPAHSSSSHREPARCNEPLHYLDIIVGTD